MKRQIWLQQAIKLLDVTVMAVSRLTQDSSTCVYVSAQAHTRVQPLQGGCYIRATL